MGDDTLRCRIQYINDLDPFVSTNNREPLKPLVYPIDLHRPVGDQIPDIIRQLRAPHKSGDAALQISPSASGDLGSYLDNDLTLDEQPDELQILKHDPRERREVGGNRTPDEEDEEEGESKTATIRASRETHQPVIIPILNHFRPSLTFPKRRNQAIRWWKGRNSILIFLWSLHTVLCLRLSRPPQTNCGEDRPIIFSGKFPDRDLFEG